MPRTAARVVGGDLRGRRLRSPAAGTRPATAAIRQSIFGRAEIRAALADANVLDLYAGAGYLGIEALSHGAAWVDFVERAAPACAVIRRNLADLGIADRAGVRHLPAERCWTRIAAPLGLAFVDPPYGVDALPVVEQLDASGLLAPDALVLWRRPVAAAGRPAAPQRIGGLVRTDQRRYGDGVLETYRAEAAQ